MLMKRVQSLPDPHARSAPYDQRAVAALAADLAGELASRYGRSASAFLAERIAEGDLSTASLPLAIYTLEAIRPGKQVAQAVVPAAERQPMVLVMASFCSAETRTAVAERIAEKGFDPRNFTLLEFVAVCGDVRAAELMIRASKDQSVKTASRTFLGTAGRILARLALPEEEGRQRSKDELAFWRTWRIHPPIRSSAGAERIAAEWMIQGGEHVSWPLLREVLHGDMIGSGPQYEAIRHLAVRIAVAQRERDAILLLQELANGTSALAREAKAALKELESALACSPEDTGGGAATRNAGRK
jgi:hypothetical protein